MPQWASFGINWPLIGPNWPFCNQINSISFHIFFNFLFFLGSGASWSSSKSSSSYSSSNWGSSSGGSGSYNPPPTYKVDVESSGNRGGEYFSETGYGNGRGAGGAGSASNVADGAEETNLFDAGSSIGSSSGSSSSQTSYTSSSSSSRGSSSAMGELNYLVKPRPFMYFPSVVQSYNALLIFKCIAVC